MRFATKRIFNLDPCKPGEISNCSSPLKQHLEWFSPRHRAKSSTVMSRGSIRGDRPRPAGPYTRMILRYSAPASDNDVKAASCSSSGESTLSLAASAKLAEQLRRDRNLSTPLDRYNTTFRQSIIRQIREIYGFCLPKAKANQCTPTFFRIRLWSVQADFRTTKEVK